MSYLPIFIIIHVMKTKRESQAGFKPGTALTTQPPRMKASESRKRKIRVDREKD